MGMCIYNNLLPTNRVVAVFRRNRDEELITAEDPSWLRYREIIIIFEMQIHFSKDAHLKLGSSHYYFQTLFDSRINNIMYLRF